MRPVIFILTALLLTLSACKSKEPEIEIREIRRELSQLNTAFKELSKSMAPGRFEIIKTPAVTSRGVSVEVGVLLDTASGDAWLLLQDETLGGIQVFDKMQRFDSIRNHNEGWGKVLDIVPKPPELAISMNRMEQSARKSDKIAGNKPTNSRSSRTRRRA